MKKRRDVRISDTYCTECGRQGISIPRPGNQRREAGHLKKIYCIYCRKETNHAEIRPYGAYRLADFRREFELGRFQQGAKLPVSALSACSYIDCKCNIDGKCWNTNHKNLCVKEEYNND